MNFYEKQKYILNSSVRKLSYLITKSNLSKTLELIGNPKQLFFRNLLSGIFRGIGIGIGVTIITAIILLLLERLVTLNLPIIGEYISDIVMIVEQSR